MTDVATQLTVDQNKSIHSSPTEQRFGYFRYLMVMGLISIGAILTVGWLAFLVWAGGKLSDFW